jgi:hypothetical protein
MYMKKSILLFSVITLIIAACSKSGGGSTGGGAGGGGGVTLNCTPVAKSFAADVLPTFQSICTNTNCHNTGSTNGPGELSTYTQIFNARSLIRAAVASGFMPKNNTLTAAQKNAILCWVDAGAANN